MHSPEEIVKAMFKTRGRLAAILQSFSIPSQRKAILTMTKKVCLAEEFLSPLPQGRRRQPPSLRGSKYQYGFSKAMREQLQFIISEIFFCMSMDKTLTKKETASLSDMMDLLIKAKRLLSAITKYFYCEAWAKSDVDGLYDNRKWKGRYTVFVQGLDGSTVCAAEGPKDLAKTLGISVKSATDKLSRVFPGKEGEGTKKAVFNGHKCKVYFILEGDE